MSCVTFESNATSGYPHVGCNITYPKMVSCGLKTESASTNGAILGTFNEIWNSSWPGYPVDPILCSAASEPNGYEIRSYARCCTFDTNIDDTTTIFSS